MRGGTRVALGLALGLTLIVVMGVVFFWAIECQWEANQQVIRTHQVLENLESALSLLKDAETGQRGFLLTGKDQYLDPYNAATKSIERKLDAVGELTTDNPAQQETLRKVRRWRPASWRNFSERSNCAGTAVRRRPGRWSSPAGASRSWTRSAPWSTRWRRKRIASWIFRTAAAEASKRNTTVTVGVWMPTALLVLALAVLALIAHDRAGRPQRTVAESWRMVGPHRRPLWRGGDRCRRGRGAARWLVAAFGPLPTFVTFYPAVLLVASIGGGGPGSSPRCWPRWRPIIGSYRPMARWPSPRRTTP